MKKVILSILSALLLFINTAGFFSISAAPNTDGPVPTPTVLAASTTPTTGTWYNQSFQEFYNKVYNPNFSAPNEIFGERYTAAQVQWVIYSLFSFVITGGSSDSAEIISCALSGDTSVCLGTAFENLKKLIPADLINNNTGQGTEQKSFLATITSNPVSGVGYIGGLVSRFHIVPEVYAQQGFGYTQTNFVQNLWRISRNISYALLVVAVIIMSFMIMFRVKISPQVVITIQSALPKIVLALVLITFSYAIAGFLIDLMYVVIGLLATVLTTDWGSGLRLSGWGSLSGGWTKMFNALTQSNMFFVLIVYWISFIITTLANLLSVAIIYSVIALFLAIISIFVLLWYSIKIIVLMFKTFFNIIISIATAPFTILAGTIMQGAGFGPWLKNLISNLMVYPVVGGMLFLANFFLKMAFSSSFLGVVGDFSTSWLFWLNPQTESMLGVNCSMNWWNPPLTTGILATGCGGSMRGILLMGVSWTIISMIPKTAELVKAIMAGKEIQTDMGGLFWAPRQAWDMTGAPLIKGIQEGYARRAVGDQSQTVTTFINKLLDRFGKPRSG